MGIKVKIIAGLSVLLLIGSLLFWGHWEQSEKEKAQAEAKTAQNRLSASERNRKISEAMQAGYAVVELIQNQRIENALSEINDLRGRVAAGSVELRVNAECPSSASVSTGTVSQNDGSGPRLTGSARHAYFTLRNRIEAITGQVNECQGYVRVIRKQYKELLNSCYPEGR